MFHCGSVVISFKNFSDYKENSAQSSEHCDDCRAVHLRFDRAERKLERFLDAVRRVESTARRLSLLSITAWLYQARQRIAFTLLPMLFVLAITLTALTSLVIGNFRAANGFDIKFVNGLASLVLIVLAVYLGRHGFD
jgi:hypothetical protein